MQPLRAVREAQGLCVFLGKDSALAPQDLKFPDAPFGRVLLERVQNEAKANPTSSFNMDLSPVRIAPQTGAINIRSRCPEVRGSKAFYGSIVAQLTGRSQIKLGDIQQVRYLDDTFYWATVTQIIPPN